MLRDVGSRDAAFIATVARIRERLLALAGVSQAAGYEAVLMQGSGTFGIESVITSAVPRDGKLLVLANGAYGERIARIASVAGIDSTILRSPEDEPVVPDQANDALASDPAISHVAVVHCETTTGLLNPIEDIGAIVKRHGRAYIVDAMSSFGAVPIDVARTGVDFLVSSANKCIEGVPGLLLRHRKARLPSCLRRQRAQRQPRPPRPVARARERRPVPLYTPDARHPRLRASPQRARRRGRRPRPRRALRRQPPHPPRRHAGDGLPPVSDPRTPELHHHVLPLPDAPELQVRRLLRPPREEGLCHLPGQGQPGRMLPNRDHRPHLRATTSGSSWRRSAQSSTKWASRMAPDAPPGATPAD